MIFITERVSANNVESSLFIFAIAASYVWVKGGFVTLKQNHRNAVSSNSSLLARRLSLSNYETTPRRTIEISTIF